MSSHSLSGAAEGDLELRVELGWVLAGAFEELDARAVEAARARVLAALRAELPRWRWELPVERRPELVEGGPVEQMRLYDQALAELSARGWDFALVVTQAELEGDEAPRAHASVSRALAAALVSTCRIDPVAQGGEPEDPEREARLAQRVAALALHALGHLLGLDHDASPESWMHRPEGVEALDAMRRFDAGERALLDASLARVADRRLEEQEGGPRSALAFHLRAAWINRRELADGVRDARPWLLPLRMSGMTIAALSTLTVLMLTAEVWDLAAQLGASRVVALSAAAVLVTSGYVLLRQRLLVRARLAEQAVRTNLTSAGIALCGMLTTWTLLFASGLAAGALLFPRPLVAEWTASVDGAARAGDYLALAGFVAAVGLVIGALGASFEQRARFRRAAYVDEEL